MKSRKASLSKRLMAVGMALTMAMALFVAMVPTTAKAAEYNDPFYNEGGLTITTNGLHADDQGDWYILFTVTNNTSDNLKFDIGNTYYGPADDILTRINNYDCWRWNSSGVTVAKNTSKEIKAGIFQSSLTQFMEDNDIDGVKDIFSVQMGVNVQVLGDSGSMTEYYNISRRTIPLHYTPVTGVAFNRNTITMVKGQSLDTYNLVNVSPNNATNAYFSQKTSDADILKAYGADHYSSYKKQHIDAINPGWAQLTVTTLDGNKTADCNVEVIKPEEDTVYNIDGEYWLCYKGQSWVSKGQRSYVLYKNSFEDRSKVRKINTLDGSIPMYRLFNPYTGEHFYTANFDEASNLSRIGWDYEGDAWYAPTSGSEVYRLYSEGTGDHHYTTSATERDVLVSIGWKYEGVAWYSGGNVAMLRAFNPYVQTGSHHYTSNQAEIDNLVSKGWNSEGVAWYAIR